MIKSADTTLPTKMYEDWVNCQKELENPVEASRGNFGKYAKLEDILKNCVPVLNKHGFALSSTSCIDGNDIWMTTSLIHRSGDSIVSKVPLKGDFKDMQKLGAAITYARRYSISMILGIEGEADPDGSKLTQKQMDELYMIQGAKGWSDDYVLKLLRENYSYNSSEEIDQFNFERIKAMFNYKMAVELKKAKA